MHWFFDSKPYLRNLPILLSTKTIFLFVPLWMTACSTWGHLQPRGSRASKTSKITSAASTTFKINNTPLMWYVYMCAYKIVILIIYGPVHVIHGQCAYLFEFSVICLSWILIFKINMLLQVLHLYFLWTQKRKMQISTTANCEIQTVSICSEQAGIYPLFKLPLSL